MTQDEIERNQFAMRVSRETIKVLGRALLEESFARLNASNPSGVTLRPPTELMIKTQLDTLVWDACTSGVNIYGYCVFVKYGPGKCRCVFCNERPSTPGGLALQALPEGV